MNSIKLTVNTLSMDYFAIEKQQICKLPARHSVPRCELADLLFLNNMDRVFKVLKIRNTGH